MPRKKFLPNPSNPVHISSRCINKEWFGLPLDQVWKICEDFLFLTNKIYKLKIHAFVLMSNHYHLIVSAPNNNLSEGMRFLNRELSRHILKSSNRINLTFGGRFFRSEIDSYHYYMNVYKYIYRNPVEAKLSTRVEEYEFSTLYGFLGRRKLIIPIEEDSILDIQNIEGTLSWLNANPPDHHKIAMKKALKRTLFKLPRDENSNKHPLELSLY